MGRGRAGWRAELERFQPTNSCPRNSELARPAAGQKIVSDELVRKKTEKGSLNAAMKSMLTYFALPPIVADMWVDRSPIAGWTRSVSVPLESETALALLRLTRFLARFQAKWVPVSRPES